MNNTNNTDAQRKRRSDAWFSAWFATFWMVLGAALLLGLRWVFQVDGLLGAIMVILSLLDLGTIIPVWILLKKRLEEIEGGEEDAAAQY